ncbi:MAG: hypothetical protein ACTTJV_10615 [Ottowia sp.]
MPEKQAGFDQGVGVLLQQGRGLVLLDSEGLRRGVARLARGLPGPHAQGAALLLIQPGLYDLLENAVLLGARIRAGA